MSKKHDVGILSNPDKGPVVKGMEGIKSDRPAFIQSTFREMINDVKNDIDPIPKLKESFNQLDSRQVLQKNYPYL